MNAELDLLCRGVSPWPPIHDQTARRARPRRGDGHRRDPMPNLARHGGASLRGGAIWLAVLAAMIACSAWVDHGQTEATPAPAQTTAP